MNSGFLCETANKRLFAFNILNSGRTIIYLEQICIISLYMFILFGEYKLLQLQKWENLVFRNKELFIEIQENNDYIQDEIDYSKQFKVNNS